MSKSVIVHIVPTLNKGGAERFVVDLCNELSLNKKEKIFLISLDDNPVESTFRGELSEDVSYLTFSRNGPRDLSVFYRLNKWLLSLKPKIVHTHLHAFEYIFPFRCISQSTSFFHTIHSKADKDCPWPKRKMLRKFFFQRNTTAITISQDGFDTYQTYYGLDNAKIIENGRPRIHTTNDYDRIRTLYKKPNEYLLVHLGRVIDVKNQKLLIEAVQLFNSLSDKKCSLLIVGAIRDEQLYQSLLQICQDDEHIKFLGQQSNVADYLSIADAFCLSSHYEGMPMSIIESFSVGCVPMSTPVGGIPEMISNGSTGFLSKDSTVESYCQAIKECLIAPNLDEIRNNCFNEYKNKYSIDICGTKHWNLYKNV